MTSSGVLVLVQQMLLETKLDVAKDWLQSAKEWKNCCDNRERNQSVLNLKSREQIVCGTVSVAVN